MRERQDIARLAARVRWDKHNDPNRTSIASHQGVLEIGDVALDAYVLEDGRRLLHKKAIANALGLKSEGGNAFLRTLSRKGIRSVISSDLLRRVESPITFRTLKGDLAHGYDAATFIEICDLFVEARHRGELHPSQTFLAVQSEIVIRSAAKLGLVALIDEATGYFEDKRKDEYRRLFEAFVAKECREWECEFPDKFFDMVYRLYGLQRYNPDSNKHPLFFRQFIRKYIYMPLANSHGAILERLADLNPIVYANGGRRFKLHQFLSEKVGVPMFRSHLWQVVGIGSAATDKDKFDRAFYRAFPEAAPRSKYDQLELFPDEGESG